MMAHESHGMKDFGRVIQESCDIEQILTVAATAQPLTVPQATAPGSHSAHPRPIIGVAHDNAFCFYYQDNIDRVVGPDLRSGISHLWTTHSRKWTPFISAADIPNYTDLLSNVRNSGSISAKR